ncbi:MAG: gliding motility protein GldN [Bacteroidota bacterium]
MKKIILSLVIVCLTGFSANAQVNYSDFITSGEHTSYKKVAVRERPVIAYPYLREADVKFSRRVIRCIDTRQKMNKQLEWPRQPLNKMLYEMTVKGDFVAYRTDSLLSFYNTEDFVVRGGYETPIWIQDDPTDASIGHDSIIKIPYDYNNIHKYWIMEDWIFDYKHSVFKPRIIALAPVFQRVVGGVKTGDDALCWLAMDQLRPTLANTEMFNRYNDAARLSYDDFFQMRIFDSYIVYESNNFDLTINRFTEYSDDGVKALIKSDEIKNDLFIFEHDLWQY